MIIPKIKMQLEIKTKKKLWKMQLIKMKLRHVEHTNTDIKVLNLTGQ